MHEPAPCPDKGWVRPGAQPRQIEEPGGVAVPRGHCVQAAEEVEPASALTVPDLQATHAEPG